MMLCPYCQFPFAGHVNIRMTSQDSFEAIRSCTHCEAILRFDVTTLKKPKESYRINTPKKKDTVCSGKPKEEDATINGQ